MIDLSTIAVGRTAGLLDRLDPRTRVLGAVVLVVTAALSPDPAGLALLLAATAVLAALGGLSPGRLARRLVHVEGFVLVLLVLLPLTTPGSVAVHLGPLALTEPGLRKALLVALRVNVAAVAILALVAGLEAVRLGRALGRLGLPAPLVHLLLFAARYVGLIAAETQRLRDAMRARGFVPAATSHGVRTLGALAGRVVLRALDRAERVDDAMRCRGYDGRLLLVAEGRFTRDDLVFALLLGFVVLLVTGLEVAR